MPTHRVCFWIFSPICLLIGGVMPFLTHYDHWSDLGLMSVLVIGCWSALLGLYDPQRFSTAFQSMSFCIFIFIALVIADGVMLIHQGNIRDGFWTLLQGIFGLALPAMSYLWLPTLFRPDDSE